MKIISWNVNGIRAAVRNGLADFLATEKPDILGLQEIKIGEEARAKTEFDFGDYQEYWHSAERPGYSGTAFLVRNDQAKAVIKVWNGIGEEQFDREGRTQTAELEKFFLVNCYFPNANGELSRLGYKRAFNRALLAYVQKLERKKPVVITGDFNVAHQPIDLARPKENEGTAGYTREEREDMDNFLAAGLVDTFRHFHPDKVQYSWWSYRGGARTRNVGWRIDYFLVSAKMIETVKTAFILDQARGSDHCPVGIMV